MDKILKKPVFCLVTQYILDEIEFYFITEISFLYSCICFGAVKPLVIHFY